MPMKIMQKYFLALMPPREIVDEAHKIKIALRDQFGIKYALKSPPHITVKMPFSYNEAKEHQLVTKLQVHLESQQLFPVRIGGVGNFGNRVIYLSIDHSEMLSNFQKGLTKFCKERLHLTAELSDRNYHPHLTVAFKDIKPNQFPEVYDTVSHLGLCKSFSADGIVLLKRVEGMWKFQTKVPFKLDF